MFDLLLAASLAVQPTAPPPPGPRGDARQPRSRLQSYFTTYDYPAAARRRGAEGIVYFGLQIDVQGRVTGCTITQSSGDADLDSTTCAIMIARGRYEPGRDERGRAVAGTDTGRVNWRLPEE